LYQRPDDRPETLRKRLEVYFSKTSPLIDYYKSGGKLLKINGKGGVAKVADDILAALENGEIRE